MSGPFDRSEADEVAAARGPKSAGDGSDDDDTPTDWIANLTPRITFHRRAREELADGDASPDAGELGADVWEAPSGAYSRSLPLAERIAQIDAVIAVARRCLTNWDPVRAVEDRLGALRARVDALGDTAGTGESRDGDAEVAAALEEIADAACAIDRSFTVATLRQSCGRHAFGDAVLTGYLRFQMENFDGSAQQWSRIDWLITRMVRAPGAAAEGAGADANGAALDAAARPAAEIAPLWQACLPPTRATERRRRSAIEFFDGAIAQLQGVDDVDELLESGLYGDIMGYKLSLRGDYFDPPVMYAAARLNIAMDTWLTRQGCEPDVVDEAFSRARERVREILHARSREFQVWVRELANTPRAAKPLPKPGPPTQPRRGRSRWRLIGALAILAVGLAFTAPVALRAYRVHTRDLAAISTDEARALHPVLLRASLGGDPPSLLVADVDPPRWRALGADGRRAALAVLAQRLMARGVTQALLYRDGVMAAHIVAGEVRFAE